ncbi:MAG: hypothetical protein H6716_03335 [Polyangiaceae bacterium]|nr:hypothetical protein [Polyangiaceae bacterium]
MRGDAQPTPAAGVISAQNQASAAPDATDKAREATAPAVSPRPCELSEKRPADFGIRIAQHILPRGREAERRGVELRGSDCKPAGDAPPCKVVPSKLLDELYAKARAVRFCSLERVDPPQRSSPHYGMRYITLFVGDAHFEVGDTSRALLTADSRKRFEELWDAVTAAQPR